MIDTHAHVDGLLNVAGIIQKSEPFIELDTADIERVLQVNFWGVVNMVRAFLPHLMRRPEAALVNVSSMGAFIPVPGQTVYGASKAAVKLLTEGLHAELRGTPVRVTVVFPGAVATGITENSGVQAPAVAGANDNAANAKVLPPNEAADIIIRGMRRGSYRVLVGRDAQVMDWFTRLVPERAMTMIAVPNSRQRHGSRTRSTSEVRGRRGLAAQHPCRPTGPAWRRSSAQGTPPAPDPSASSPAPQRPPGAAPTPRRRPRG